MPALSPVAGPYPAVGFGHSARDRQHQSQRQIRGAVDQDPRSVTDGDAEPGRTSNIDMINTHRNRGDHLQSRRVLEQRCTDGCGQRAEQAVGVSEPIHEYRLGHWLRFRPRRDVVGVAQCVDHVTR